MSLFPLFLKLEGRECLVVGAGSIGEAKIASLLESGAAVTVVSPTATETVRSWAATGRVIWIRRRFESHDLDDKFLVVAAIPTGEALTRIADEARRRGVLSNAVDDPPNCDFYYPSVVRRGDLQIAISTSGLSPALAQRIRKELEAQFGPDYESWLSELGRQRAALFASDMDPELRKRMLHELASGEAFERDRKGYRLQAAGSTREAEQSDSSVNPEARSAKPEAPDLEREARSLRSEVRSPKPGKVFLIGAGPGDPELLTLKALRALGGADVVLHDDLVAAEVLELVPPSAELRNVGKRHGEHHISQGQIHELLIQHAREGHTVVRLKGGDVAIFGRANEEIAALEAAGVDFEIVPGVTAASAAAAAASISLTDRRATSAVVFVTAQTCLGNARPQWRALVASGATLAIYMPGLDYGRVVGELLSAGLRAETPCLVVSRASQENEATLETTIGALASVERLPAPAILIVGEVVRNKNTEYRRQNTEDGIPTTEHRMQKL